MSSGSASHLSLGFTPLTDWEQPSSGESFCGVLVLGEHDDCEGKRGSVRPRKTTLRRRRAHKGRRKRS